MMDKKDAAELLARYQAGIATDEEKAQVEAWYAGLNEQASPVSQQQVEEDAIWSRKQLRQQHFPVRVIRRWPRMLAAAAVLALIATSVYWLIQQQQPGRPAVTATTTVKDIRPGGDKAILTLANGQQITLDDVQQGTVASQSGITITKTAQGQLVYTIASTKEGQEAGDLNAINTITTPRGGQYQVVLPDGTHVWLNAASSLQYPVVFKPSGRQVQLSGEACFEVAADKARPFRIVTDANHNHQLVEVLGTTLNINAYDDEAAIKTTLIDGAIRVKQQEGDAGKLLKPGQQAVIQAAGFAVNEVDADAAIAWKNGYFVFDEEDLAGIMRKIARWYDVEIEYKDQHLRTERFNGTVSRYGLVSQVIKVLELTQVAHFTLAGNKIVITP